jgi:hypothetical protein
MGCEGEQFAFTVLVKSRAVSFILTALLLTHTPEQYHESERFF